MTSMLFSSFLGLANRFALAFSILLSPINLNSPTFLDSDDPKLNDSPPSPLPADEAKLLTLLPFHRDINRLHFVISIVFLLSPGPFAPLSLLLGPLRVFFLSLFLLPLKDEDLKDSDLYLAADPLLVLLKKCPDLVSHFRFFLRARQGILCFYVFLSRCRLDCRNFVVTLFLFSSCSHHLLVQPSHILILFLHWSFPSAGQKRFLLDGIDLEIFSLSLTVVPSFLWNRVYLIVVIAYPFALNSSFLISTILFLYCPSTYKTLSRFLRPVSRRRGALAGAAGTYI